MSKENQSIDLLENKKIEPYILIHDILVNWWVLLLGALAAAMLSYMVVNIPMFPHTPHRRPLQCLQDLLPAATPT